MFAQPHSSNRAVARWLDVGGQVLCFLIPLGYWLSVKDNGLDGALSFVYIYLAVGAWQLISCIGWLIATRWKNVSAGRKLYLGAFGFLTLATLPLFSSDPATAIIFVLVGTGVLAIFYLILSIAEARAEGKARKPHVEKPDVVEYTRSDPESQTRF